MKAVTLSIFILITIIAAHGAFADISTNTDFNPFPQMEQDMSNTSDTAAPVPQQGNDDWPPANADAQSGNGGRNE